METSMCRHKTVQTQNTGFDQTTQLKSITIDQELNGHDTFSMWHGARFNSWVPDIPELAGILSVTYPYLPCLVMSATTTTR